MINYSNIQRIENMPFEEYLKLEGYSLSFLKSNVQGVATYFNVTEKVSIGKLVDTILTSPENADMSDEFYPACKAIAFEIKKVFGDLFKMASKQVAFTANLSVGDFEMKSKGILDLLLERMAVIDLKITDVRESQIDNLIEYMGYNNQLWHYGRLANVKKAYLLFYLKRERKVVVKNIDITNDHNDFWMNKVIDFGIVK